MAINLSSMEPERNWKASALYTIVSPFITILMRVAFTTASDSMRWRAVDFLRISTSPNVPLVTRFLRYLKSTFL